MLEGGGQRKGGDEDKRKVSILKNLHVVGVEEKREPFPLSLHFLGGAEVL